MNKNGNATIALFGAIAILAVGALFVAMQPSVTGNSAKWSRQLAVTPQPELTGLLQCSETDKGNDQKLKGTTTGIFYREDATPVNVKSKGDYCTTICQGDYGSGQSDQGPCLVEFYCADYPPGAEGYAAFNVIACRKGCVDGVCVPNNEHY